MVQSSAAAPIDINADVDADTRLDADDDALDLVFAALSDRTRRNVLGALTDRGEGLSVSELAQPHGMSLTGFMKHLRVLEEAGLVSRTKEGRIVRCQLSPAPMQEAAVWLSHYEKFWAGRLDALARFLYHQEETEWRDPSPGAKSAPRSPSGEASTPLRPRSGGPGPSRRR